MTPLYRTLALALALACAAAAVPRPAGAESTTAMPRPLRDVGYDQRLGEQVPLDLLLRDEANRTVRLGDYFGERPVVLEGAAASLKVLRFEAGREFDVVVVSFDPRDTAERAAEVKREIVARYGKPGAAAGWHFLSGGEGQIARLTRAVGFRYYFDEQTRQYAHAAGLVLLTPSGRIARYFYGVEFPPRDVRLGLVEASGERIGSLVDQVLLFCFHYDPVIGRYSAMTMNLVRAGGIVTVLGLALAVLLLRRRERNALRAA